MSVCAWSGIRLRGLARGGNGGSGDGCCGRLRHGLGIGLDGFDGRSGGWGKRVILSLRLKGRVCENDGGGVHGGAHARARVRCCLKRWETGDGESGGDGIGVERGSESEIGRAHV